MIEGIVIDVEGTTTSIAFVKDVLFPYARLHIADFVRQNHFKPKVAALLDDVRKEIGQDLDIEVIISQLIIWIDLDQKITPLKSLQGLIWEVGYQRGDYQAHIYPDAAAALKAWKQQGIDLYVYSSGSIEAQKLLFTYTELGDLTPLFSGYFDTHIGGKMESRSYQQIADQIQLAPHQLLFLSDSKEELDAAKFAGFHTCWMAREQQYFYSAAEHYPVASFADIDLQSVAMRFS